MKIRCERLDKPQHVISVQSTVITGPNIVSPALGIVLFLYTAHVALLDMDSLCPRYCWIDERTPEQRKRPWRRYRHEDSRYS